MTITRGAWQQTGRHGAGAVAESWHLRCNHEVERAKWKPYQLLKPRSSPQVKHFLKSGHPSESSSSSTKGEQVWAYGGCSHLNHNTFWGFALLCFLFLGISPLDYKLWRVTTFNIGLLFFFLNWRDLWHERTGAGLASGFTYLQVNYSVIKRMSKLAVEVGTIRSMIPYLTHAWSKPNSVCPTGAAVRKTWPSMAL